MGNINETKCRINDIRKATLKCLRHQIKQSTYVNWMPTMCSAVCQLRQNKTRDLWYTCLEKYMMDRQWNWVTKQNKITKMPWKLK